MNFDEQATAAAIAIGRAGDRLVLGSRREGRVPLPGTRREVEAIAALFRQSTVLLGPDASEAELEGRAARGDLGLYDFLLLATHGKADYQVAMNSRLLLGRGVARIPGSPDDSSPDGELTAQQMLNWKLDAELVTLSACESGLGQYASGEGFLGFAQAIFRAGARTAVLSLWKVDDQATALLMTRFHQNLLGRRAGLDHPMPKAEALVEAKRWLRRPLGGGVGQDPLAMARGEIRKLKDAGAVATTPGSPRKAGAASPMSIRTTGRPSS